MWISNWSSGRLLAGSRFGRSDLKFLITAFSTPGRYQRPFFWTSDMTDTNMLTQLALQAEARGGGILLRCAR
jgi:hypothetical protein